MRISVCIVVDVFDSSSCESGIECQEDASKDQAVSIDKIVCWEFVE